MNTKEAVAKRIWELCKKNKLNINALANISGVSPSTIYSMLNEKSKNPGVVSLKKICDGLEISIREFFDSDIFDDIEQEIKWLFLFKHMSGKSCGWKRESIYRFKKLT